MVKVDMKRISPNYLIIFFAIVLFSMIILMNADIDFSEDVPVYSTGETINTEDFLFYASYPVKGYNEKTTLLKIGVRNLTDKPIAVTSYLTGNTSEDIYDHYFLFMERKGKIYPIEGEFLTVNPTDGTKKYDVPGNLYLDIPIEKINQYTYLLISSDKKAEDVILKINLN